MGEDRTDLTQVKYSVSCEARLLPQKGCLFYHRYCVLPYCFQRNRNLGVKTAKIVGVHEMLKHDLRVQERLVLRRGTRKGGQAGANRVQGCKQTQVHKELDSSLRGRFNSGIMRKANQSTEVPEQIYKISKNKYLGLTEFWRKRNTSLLAP